ncbi:hypothetical protein D9M72_401510 [compost metagenome]
MHRREVRFGQWHARGHGLDQGGVAAIAAHGRGAVQAKPRQQPFNLGRRVARADLGDVARLPVHCRIALRRQRQVERRRALAAGVQMVALHEPPAGIARAFPVGNLRAAAQGRQVVLPVAQRAGVAVVDFDQVKERLRTVALQPAVERVAEGAEARVATVAEREDAVAQGLQAIRASQQAARKTGRAVGGVALAGGADQEQRLAACLQAPRIDIGQRQQLHRHARALQRGGGLQRQLFGKPGLRGIGN